METQPLAALYAALAKAQGQMSAASKSNTNPHFKSKYADLADVWEAARKPLSENGIAVIQRVMAADGGVKVITTLAHSGGGTIDDDPPAFPVAQKTPQGFGSAITYARRYGFAAMIGAVAEVDDDGNAASMPTPVAAKSNSNEDTLTKAIADAKSLAELDMVSLRIAKEVPKGDMRLRLGEAWKSRKAELANAPGETVPQ